MAGGKETPRQKTKTAAVDIRSCSRYKSPGRVVMVSTIRCQSVGNYVDSSLQLPDDLLTPASYFHLQLPNCK